jgi:hypothetical protein
MSSNTARSRSRIFLNRGLAWCIDWTNAMGKRVARRCGKGAEVKARAMKLAQELRDIDAGAELPAPDVVVRRRG